jgi:ribosomal protein L29
LVLDFFWVFFGVPRGVIEEGGDLLVFLGEFVGKIPCIVHGGELFELRTTVRGELFELRTTVRGELFELRTTSRGELFALRTTSRGGVVGIKIP